MRLFDGPGDGISRLVIERYGDAFRARGGPERAGLLPLLRAQFSPLFWRFGYEVAGGPEGDDGLRTIVEAGLKFPVQMLGPRNPGLFLDGRPARAWVRAHADGRRILNLFSFTCGFGVVAAAGGARSTTNVDSVRGVLTRGAALYALNGQPHDGRTFWKQDVMDALKRAKKQGAWFDGIILDAPPIAQRRRGGRALDPVKDLARMAAACRKVLAPEGWMLVLSATPALSTEALVKAIELGEPIWRGGADADFIAPEGQAGLRAFAFAQPR